jgi:hypothetical protein
VLDLGLAPVLDVEPVTVGDITDEERNRFTVHAAEHAIRWLDRIELCGNHIDVEVAASVAPTSSNRAGHEDRNHLRRNRALGFQPLEGDAPKLRPQLDRLRG